MLSIEAIRMSIMPCGSILSIAGDNLYPVNLWRIHRSTKTKVRRFSDIVLEHQSFHFFINIDEKLISRALI